tara:strand:+ start:184 stop:543 length:360 start_codon:yes stop_codon:yes gene_type:complete
MSNDKPRAVLYYAETWEESQDENCREYAEEEGYEVIFKTEVHRNGDHVDKLLEMAEEGHFEVLVVEQPNLLSRNLGAFLDIADKFNEFGVSVEFVPPPDKDKNTHVAQQAVLMGANGQK